MRLILLSILICFTSLLNAQSIEWSKHKSEESKISFKMPNKIQILNKELNSIKSQVFQTKDLTCIYGIVASRFKKYNFSKEPINDIYKEMKAGSLYDNSAILLDEHSTIYKKMLVKEIKYSTVHQKTEYTYYKRFIFRGHYIYQISIGAMSRHANELEANKEIFFNTINFLK